MPFCATFKQRAFIKKRTHTERMKKRLSVRNEKQREEEKENEREIDEGSKRETYGERRRGHKGQKVNRQNFSGIFTFTMNVIMCECACVE